MDELEILLSDPNFAEAVNMSEPDAALSLLAQNGIFVTEEELMNRLFPVNDDELSEDLLENVSGGSGTSPMMNLLKIYTERLIAGRI